jgi:hypothetical protein
MGASDFISIRTNLAEAIFPFESSLQGRSIIFAGQDENYNYLDEMGEPVRDRGIPVALYMHNVMPTAQGYQSVGYEQQIVTNLSGASLDDIVTLLYANPEAVVLFSPSLGNNYIYSANTNTWVSTNPQAAGVINASTMVTYAYVDGVTYFCYEGVGVFKFNPTTLAIDTVTLTGLVIGNIKGICSAYGYLIAWTDTTIYWSAAEDPTTFTPSLITGAGSQGVQSASGAINFCAPIAGGFMIYCQRNTVGATYTGNINFPFSFREVAGSGGCADPKDCTFFSNQSDHFAWTSAGIQALNLSSANNVFPEATEFLEKLIFEDFDETTNLLTQSYLTTPLYTALSLIANRYLVISYGTNLGKYTHALVYDLTLSRWGKLKYPHVRCFEFQRVNPYGTLTYALLSTTYYSDLSSTTYGQLSTGLANNYDIADKNIAFMDSLGNVFTVDFDLSESLADGVLIMGKYQYVRDKMMIHQFTEVENVVPTNVFSAYVIPTLDGKTFKSPVLMSTGVSVLSQGELVAKYGARVVGRNLSILFKGAFNMVSFQLGFTLGGNR